MKHLIYITIIIISFFIGLNWNKPVLGVAECVCDKWFYVEQGYLSKDENKRLNLSEINKIIEKKDEIIKFIK